MPSGSTRPSLTTSSGRVRRSSAHSRRMRISRALTAGGAAGSTIALAQKVRVDQLLEPGADEPDTRLVLEEGTHVEYELDPDVAEVVKGLNGHRTLGRRDRARRAHVRAEQARSSGTAPRHALGDRGSACAGDRGVARDVTKLAALVLVAGALTAGGTAPVATSRPAVFGTLQQGSRLTANPGSWAAGDAITFAYQVPMRPERRTLHLDPRRDAGELHAGARRRRPLPRGGRARPTSGGSAVAYGPLAGLVAAASARFAAAAQPSLVGEAIVGRSAVRGRRPLDRRAPPATYRWLRCNANGRRCSSIGGARSVSYGIAPARRRARTDRSRFHARSLSVERLEHRRTHGAGTVRTRTAGDRRHTRGSARD